MAPKLTDSPSCATSLGAMANSMQQAIQKTNQRTAYMQWTFKSTCISKALAYYYAVSIQFCTLKLLKFIAMITAAVGYGSGACSSAGLPSDPSSVGSCGSGSRDGGVPSSVDSCGSDGVLPSSAGSSASGDGVGGAFSSFTSWVLDGRCQQQS